MQDDIISASEVILKGGVILYPTDTIWGLGCDATNEKAVQRIYEIKKRLDTKSMLVLLDNENSLPRYVYEVPEVAWQILDVAENPLTLIYPGAINIAQNLIADDGSIGIRITSDSFCEKLICKIHKPLVSTSANISGKNSPSNFNEISDDIKRQVDYIVKWRQDDFSKKQPSGIIKVGLRGEVEVIRE